jgi:uncharacterized membrane protein (DUF373 family)
MLNILKKIETILVAVILLMLSVILVLALIDIVHEIVRMVSQSPILVIDANNLMELFSLFLIIIIGLELLETVKAFLKDDVVHIELVILVAIIAIARKVIVWDFNKYDEWELIGLAIMVTSLSLSYYLLKKSDFHINIKRKKKNLHEPPTTEIKDQH